MEVGALLVGRIVNHDVEQTVSRGEEKGYFEFGGSTVIVAVQAGQVRIDEDIWQNSAEGIETVVKQGEKDWNRSKSLNWQGLCSLPDA